MAATQNILSVPIVESYINPHELHTKLGKTCISENDCSSGKISHDISTCRLARKSFWNMKCMCLFSGLPDEIMIANVFSFLSAEQLCRNMVVCNRWKFMSADRFLWRKFDLSKNTQFANPKLLTSLKKNYGNSLEILNLCNCNLLTEPFLISLFSSQFNRLLDLHLCNLSISDAVLLNIAKNCHSLTGLSLSGCLGVTDFGVQIVAKMCLQLEEISLRRCTELTNKALLHFGKTMKSLNVGSCTKITSEALSILSQNLSHLERLNLHGIKVTDESVSQLAQGCTTLKTLHLSSANPFGGGSLLTNAVAESLSNLSGLRCLNIQGASNVTDASLAVIGCKCTFLKRLNVGGCYRLTDRGMFVLATTTQLTHLSVFQCFNLTDRGVMAVMRSLPLELLDVHSCVGLTGTCLTAIPTKQTTGGGLKFLNIGSCRNICNEDVITLKQRMPYINIRHY